MPRKEMTSLTLKEAQALIGKQITIGDKGSGDSAVVTNVIIGDEPGSNTFALELERVGRNRTTLPNTSSLAITWI